MTPRATTIWNWWNPIPILFLFVWCCCFRYSDIEGEDDDDHHITSGCWIKDGSVPVLLIDYGAQTIQERKIDVVDVVIVWFLLFMPLLLVFVHRVFCHCSSIYLTLRYTRSTKLVRVKVLVIWKMHRRGSFDDQNNNNRINNNKQASSFYLLHSPLLLLLDRHPLHIQSIIITNVINFK